MNKTDHNLQNFLLNTATRSQWEHVGIRPHHGIAIILSSLKREKNLGVGEFIDLIPIIDWCREIGLDVIQLLPLNESYDDPSPFNAISSCALDPIFLNLQELPYVNKDKVLLDKLKLFEPFRKKKNVEHHLVKMHKLAWLEEYFQAHFHRFEKDSEYQKFLDTHSWLREYTLFRALLKVHKGCSWKHWPQNEQKFSVELIKEYQREIDFFTLVQYLCTQQLETVKNYAHGKKVLLKGDIPILLNPASSDVWAYPHLFCLKERAGAPPDLYSPEGQAWGFPLFNWGEMKDNHYSWWRRRLHVAENYYDIYRIDHVVGFFRIWSVPLGKKPIEGHFVPENRYQWPFRGRELLEMMIDSSKMLPMAEDLGTIPPEVYSTLKSLGICGTKFMRWERYWDEDGSFIPPSDYEPISLTTISTHDSETLEQYWMNHPVDAEIYARIKGWKYNPKITENQRESILYDAHHSNSIFHINLLGEYLAFFPELSWESPEDERINVPGTENSKNWTYRLRPTIEELTAHEGLKKKISKLIA